MIFRLIDLTKPISFYDDRSKGVDYFCDRIVYKDNDMCLCYCKQFDEDMTVEGLSSHDTGMILFNIHTGQVINSRLDSYIAQNI